MVVRQHLLLRPFPTPTFPCSKQLPRSICYKVLIEFYVFSVISLLLSTSPALWWKRRGFKILSSPWSSRSAWCQASTSLQSWRLAMATWGDTGSSGGTHFIELRTYSTEGRAPTTALLLAGQVTPITGRVEMSLRCWKRR